MSPFFFNSTAFFTIGANMRLRKTFKRILKCDLKTTFRINGRLALSLLPIYMQGSPKRLLEDGRGSLYCCLLLIIPMPVLEIVSWYSVRPVIDLCQSRIVSGAGNKI